MFSPQQLADALEQSDVDGTAAALAELVFESHPALAARLVRTAFGGKLSKPQTQARARADAIFMAQEMGATDYRERAACIAVLHYGREITALVESLALGTGIPASINREALRIKNLICADATRKAARMDVLRAATPAEWLNFFNQQAGLPRSGACPKP